jgi:hypothetical protein
MNAYTSQVLEDGARNYIIKLTAVLDTADQPLTTVITPSDCTKYIPTRFRIDHIDFTISDQLELQLWWEGTPDAIILPMAGRNKFNYNDLGGLQNNASSPTGGIRIKTTGYATGTQVYSVLIWLVKQGIQ